jgi:hypothetical protein
VDEPTVHRVVLWLCSMCLDGEAGECHTPGCALWLNRAPDLSIRTSPMVESIDGATLDYETLTRRACPVHADQEHGGEAEELRKGIERILTAFPDKASRRVRCMREELQRLLDDVDARDSLAWLERHDERREAEVDQLRARIAELEAAHA